MEIYRFFVFIGLLLSIFGMNSPAGISLAFSGSSGVRLPERWYQLPEQQMSVLASVPTQSPSPELMASVDSIYQVTQQGLDAIILPPVSGVTALDAGHPADWTPWHLDAFTTDLAVNAQGLLGVLTVKGTPAVSAIWRHRASSSKVEESVSGSSIGALSVIFAQVQDGNVWPQIEPAYRLAMATGKIQDGEAFKTNWVRTASEWHVLAQNLSEQLASDHPSEWWVSGFRCDFLVSASGNVVPAHVDLGGEVRIRLEWRRLQRIPLASGSPVTVSQKKSSLFTAFQQEKLQELLLVLEQSLESAVLRSEGQFGSFVPYAFRAGIGMTVNGNFGVARGALTALGQVNFSRDLAHRGQQSRVISAEGVAPEIWIIDSTKTASMTASQLAKTYGLSVTELGDQLISKISQERLTDGLDDALKMLGFFTRGQNLSGSGQSNWPLYELRGSFDLSLTGSLGFVGVGGLASTMIYMRQGVSP